MESIQRIHILNSPSIKLIEYGDQLNRKLAGFLKALSGFIIGIIAVVFLLPIAAAIIVVTTIASRAAFSYVSFLLKKLLKNIPQSDERELMEILIEIENLKIVLGDAQPDQDASKANQIYHKIFFGSSLQKCINLSIEIQKNIEAKVYPNLNSKPSKEDIQRLLKEYEGLETN